MGGFRADIDESIRDVYNPVSFVGLRSRAFACHERVTAGDLKKKLEAEHVRNATGFGRRGIVDGGSWRALFWPVCFSLWDAGCCLLRDWWGGICGHGGDSRAPRFRTCHIRGIARAGRFRHDAHGRAPRPGQRDKEGTSIVPQPRADHQEQGPVRPPRDH